MTWLVTNHRAEAVAATVVNLLRPASKQGGTA